MSTTKISEVLYDNQFRILLIVAASFIILAGAWGYEIIGGYSPCALCLKQRWAYYFAIPAGLIGLWAQRQSLNGLTMVVLVLLAAAFAANMALGVYHSGVEWKFWQGPAECSMGAGFNGSGSVLDRIDTTKFVSCTDAAWRFLGISFAGYNALFSLGLSLFTVWTLFTLKK